MHQCAKRTGEAHAMQIETAAEQLSDEVLNLIKLHDIAEVEQLSLSCHALDGTEGTETIRLRAMIGNQVLLILVDSGSSSCFINTAMLNRIECNITDTSIVSIKIANGDTMQCSLMIPALSWLCQGHTFSTDMRVLELEAYDAILGMDWLKKHSPMVTD